MLKDTLKFVFTFIQKITVGDCDEPVQPQGIVLCVEVGVGQITMAKYIDLKVSLEMLMKLVPRGRYKQVLSFWGFDCSLLGDFGAMLMKPVGFNTKL